MSMLNEIQKALTMASIALSEQAGGDTPLGPPPGWTPPDWPTTPGWVGDGWADGESWGGTTWNWTTIWTLGQVLMHTEQYGSSDPAQHWAEAGFVVSPDPDGGIGSGNIQPGMWADAWGYSMPLTDAQIQLYNSMMSGTDSVYWIGVTALLYAMRYATPEVTDCGGDFSCILSQIYAHYLRGPSGMNSKKWGKLADTGLNNFLNGWNRIVEILWGTPQAETDTEHEVESGDTLTAIANQYGTTVDAISKKNNIENPDMISPGQIITIP